MKRRIITALVFAVTWALAIVSGLSVGGCVSISIPLEDGRVARYTRIGATSLDGLKVTHGETTVEVQGYRSEGAELAEALARGAVQGAAGGIKP